jgi:hypothetical protein
MNKYPYNNIETSIATDNEDRLRFKIDQHDAMYIKKIYEGVTAHKPDDFDDKFTFRIEMNEAYKLRDFLVFALPKNLDDTA